MTINADGVFEKVNGGLWVEARGDRVTTTSDGDIVNSGERPINVLLQGSLTVDTGGVGMGDAVAVRVVKGTDINSSGAVGSESIVDSLNETNVYVAASFVLDPLEYAAIWLTNLDSDDNVPVTRGKLLVFGKV